MRRISPPCLVLIFGMMALGGCETPLVVQTFPQITFAHLAPFNLNVNAIDIVDEYRAPLAAPNVDHLFPTPPEKALRQWGLDRLRPRGFQNRAQFVIVNGSVIEEKLKIDKGFTGQFKKQQSERYTARIEGILRIVDTTGTVRARAAASASRSTTIREDATLNDREKLWFDMTEALMKDFNAEMEKNITRHLRDWLK